MIYNFKLVSEFAYVKYIRNRYLIAPKFELYDVQNEQMVEIFSCYMKVNPKLESFTWGLDQIIMSITRKMIINIIY